MMLFTEGSPEQRSERGDGREAGVRVCVCVAQRPRANLGYSAAPCVLACVFVQPNNCLAMQFPRTHTHTAQHLFLLAVVTGLAGWKRVAPMILYVHMRR